MKYTYEKKAKLVGNIEKGMLWLLNREDDWIHDQYGESYIYYGTIHSSREPFHPLSTSITGYFQDHDSKLWIKVKGGLAKFTPGEIEKCWFGQIEEQLHVKIKTGIYKYYKKTKIPL